MTPPASHHGIARTALLRRAAACALLLVASAAAAEPLALSADVTVELDGVTAADEVVVVDGGSGPPAVVPLPPLPAAADLNAYEALPNGEHLLAFDTTVTLAGGVVARPCDVVRWDGASFTIAFDGASMGVPDGTMVDAVAVAGGDLVLSFDTTIDVLGLEIADEDLVRVAHAGADLVFRSLGGLELFMDLSSAGIAEAADLDAVSVAADGRLFVSFDTSGTAKSEAPPNLRAGLLAQGDVPYDDEDVLVFGTEWAMAYDGSAAHAAWGPADVDAVSLVATAPPTTTTTSSTSSTSRSTSSSTSTSTTSTSSTTSTTVLPTSTTTTSTTAPPPTAPPVTAPSTTTTTLPEEVCGNCVDDDGDGLDDFVDPDCCTASGAIDVRKVTLQPRRKSNDTGPVKLRAFLRGAFTAIDPLADDTTLLLASGGTPIACAHMPATAWRRRRGARKFEFRGGSAGGLTRGIVLVRRSGTVRFDSRGRAVDLRPFDARGLRIGLRSGETCADVTLRMRRKGKRFVPEVQS